VPTGWPEASGGLGEVVAEPVLVASERGPTGAFRIVLRVGVSALALGVVFTRVPVREVAGSITTLDPFWLTMAFVFVYAAILLSAYKWKLLLEARGYSLGLGRLTRHYFVGLFFNDFLPTSVGGDVVRAWDAGRDLEDAPEGAASVIAERLVASFALGVTAALGLLAADAGPRAAIAVVVVLVASAAFVALFLWPARSAAMVRGAMGGRFDPAADSVGRCVHAVNDTLRSRGRVAAVFALSIAFQVLVALVNWCIFRALGAPVTLGACVVFTSIISAVTMVPISISGHGVREAGYAYFFGLVGVASAVAVSASLLFFAVVAIATLPGAAFFAIGRRS